MNLVYRLRKKGSKGQYAVSDALMLDAADHIEQLREQLAASQAREQQLRDVIWSTNQYIDQTYSDLIGSLSSEWLAAQFIDDLSPQLSKALALPQDTSALDQIKASYEAQIEQLLEALEKVIVTSITPLACRIAQDALALPQDDTALRSIVAKAGEVMRERCASVCLSLFDLDDDSCNEAEQCAGAIRALPAISLEDLQK